MVSTCWSHILSLAAEEIRSKNKLLDHFIAGVMASLVKCSSRQQDLQDKLRRAGGSTHLPPTPVLTRWGTWLEAAA